MGKAHADASSPDSVECSQQFPKGSYVFMAHMSVDDRRRRALLLPKTRRMSIGALIVIDVHAKDLVLSDRGHCRKVLLISHIRTLLKRWPKTTLLEAKTDENLTGKH